MSETTRQPATGAIARIDTSKALALPQLQQAFTERMAALREMYSDAKSAAPSRLVRAAMLEISKNDKLQRCTARSLLECVNQAATLNLDIGGVSGHCYMVPYGATAQFQLGYKGMIQLAYRSKLVASITAQAVRDGDLFEVQFGTKSGIDHRPGKTRGPITHVYAVITYLRGGIDFEVMEREQIEEHRKKYSKFGTGANGQPSGTWASAWDAMALKTVIRRLLKRAPIGVDVDKYDAEPAGEVEAAEEPATQLPEHETPEAEYEEVETQPNSQASPPVQQTIVDHQQPAGDKPLMAGEQIIGAILTAAYDANLTWSDAIEQYGLECGIPLRDGITPKDLTAKQATELLAKLKAAKAA